MKVNGTVIAKSDMHETVEGNIYVSVTKASKMHYPVLDIRYLSAANISLFLSFSLFCMALFLATTR